jgi:hypothetical protein
MGRQESEELKANQIDFLKLKKNVKSWARCD